MKSYRTSKILSIGDKYRSGTIVNIETEDGGWIITIHYKHVPDRQIFVYHI